MKQRIRCLISAVGISVLCASGVARAQVDLNGTFDLTIPSLFATTCAATVTQVGSAIELDVECGFMQFGGVGTIDTMSGVFSISGGCVLGPLFGALTMTGTGAGDSATFAGELTCPPAVPGGPYAYAASREDLEGACSLLSGCRDPGKSLLLIKDSENEATDKLLWKWLKGAATTTDDFGVPTGTSAYTLCVYAGTAAIVEVAVPADAMKWQAVGDKGWKFNDPAATGGVQKVLLKSGAAGKSKIVLKGKGATLPDPGSALPVLPAEFPISVQLQRNGTALCWESSFAEADVKKNTGDLFKAKSP
jgi:hypothetical protein